MKMMSKPYIPNKYEETLHCKVIKNDNDLLCDDAFIFAKRPLKKLISFMEYVTASIILKYKLY